MELILSIVALTKGLYTVVASSLIGSILSNLLLVLGEHHICPVPGNTRVASHTKVAEEGPPPPPPPPRAPAC